ncbi:TolC family protein [candidate division KSB1 bacterium]|nr:TolC family protein [candidate division KSB1 bacterium]
MKRVLFYLFILCFIVHPLLYVNLNAQDVLVLNLEESIEIALDESYSIKQLRESMNWAEWNLWAAKAGYRTSIESRIYTPVYEEGYRLVDVVEGTPVAKQFGSQQVRGVLDLRQPMPWIPFGGADMTLRSEAYRLDSWTPSNADPEVDIKSSKFYTSLSLIVNKPLFTINETALNLKRAKLSYERRSRAFKRSELDLVFQVTQMFYQLYSWTQRMEIDRDKVRRQEDIYQTTSNKFKAGLIAEVDAMQAEVDLIEFRNDLKRSEGMLAEVSSRFKQLIGVPFEVDVHVITELEPKRVEVDQAQALNLALANRSELVEKKIDIEEQKISIEQIDAQSSVNGNLMGYYDLSGFSDPAFAWGTDTEQLFRSSWDGLQQTPNRGFTFELEVPIFDWGRNKAQVEAAKANMRQDELDYGDLTLDIIREVQDVVRTVYQSWDQLQMLTKSKAVGEKSFDISLKRFNNGDITSTELSRASDQLNQAKLSYLTAYVDYKVALADLKRKTLFDFDLNQSLME